VRSQAEPGTERNSPVPYGRGSPSYFIVRIMPSPAQVHSVDAIELFCVQLAKYEQRVQSALETLTSELRRASEWLQHDRPSFWKQQTKLAEDTVHQAKLDLERCLIFPIAGEQPTCREEKAVLKKTQLRVEYCRGKSERVRHWNRHMQHEMFEYEGRVGQLRRILETELPAARAKLQQIIRRLDAYQIERTPHSPEMPSKTSPSQETQTTPSPKNEA